MSANIIQVPVKLFDNVLLNYLGETGVVQLQTNVVDRKVYKALRRGSYVLSILLVVDLSTYCLNIIS